MEGKIKLGKSHGGEKEFLHMGITCSFISTLTPALLERNQQGKLNKINLPINTFGRKIFFKKRKGFKRWINFDMNYCYWNRKEWISKWKRRALNKFMQIIIPFYSQLVPFMHTAELEPILVFEVFYDETIDSQPDAFGFTYNEICVREGQKVKQYERIEGGEGRRSLPMDIFLVQAARLCWEGWIPGKWGEGEKV